MENRSIAFRHPFPLDPDPTTTVRDIALIAFRQRRKFLLVVLFTFLLACFWTFGTGKRYTSEMVLLVQNARGNDVVTSGSSTVTAANDVTEEQLNSEIAVLNSSDLLDETVDQGWAKDMAGHSRADLLRHGRNVVELRGHLDISAIRSSHAITVKLTSADPEHGRETLTRLLNAFLVKQSELGRPPGTSKFFSDRATQYEDEIAKAREALAKYQREHGFVSLDAHEANLAQELYGLNTKIGENETQISDARRRMDVDLRTLGDTEKRLLTVERKASASGAIDQLNTLLVSLANRRTELLTIYQPDDRLVKQIDQQIADTKAGIGNATSMNSNEVSTDVNPLWLAANSDLNSNRTRFEGLSAIHAQLSSQTNKLQGELNNSESLSPEFRAIQQKVSGLEAGYQQVLQKRDASLMADMMDRQQWLNLAVIESPTFPLFPSHPKPARDLSLGALTALFLGTTAIFLFESARRTVATPEELEAVSGFPVLMVVPLHITPPAKLSERYGYLVRSSDVDMSCGPQAGSQD